MPNATDFVASTLPALSVERYSTVCWPSAETVKAVANGLAPPVLALRTQSPPSTRYSVAPTPLPPRPR